MMKRTGAIPTELGRYIELLLDGLNTPLASRVKTGIKDGVWDSLPKTVRPEDYPLTTEGAMQFRDDFQVVELLRKRTFGGSVTPKKRRDAALESWLQSERDNYRTNQRISPWLHGYPRQLEPSAAAQMYHFICCVKKEIRRVLGRLPKRLDGRFSSGTNYGELQTYHTVLHKLMMPSVTPDLRRVLAMNCEGLKLPEAWERALSSVGITVNNMSEVQGERFSTVSKNYETDRTIGVQPVVNLYFQLGVGQYWRPLLLRNAALDLQHGQATHSRLAREASISNGDATIDLRNASNSMCTKVVELFFSEWFDLLDLLRCKTIKIKGKVHRLEMFSAMGNGFTFELETVFFYAVCRACGVVKPYVYGDDIIVPKELAPTVIAALRYFGFQTNPQKTFLDGPFRESCGGNFFLGVDVTPIRLTEAPNKPSDWFTLHNQAYKLGPRAVLAKKYARAQLPAELRLLGGPPCLGDTVLWGIPPQRRWRGQIGFIKVWRPIPVKWSWRRCFDGWDSSQLQMAVALSGLTGESSNTITEDRISPEGEVVYRSTPHALVQRGVSGYKIGRTAWSGDATVSYSGDGISFLR